MGAVPLIALLTDFGVADGYPGVMKGVMLGIAPGIPLVDLTHEIPPQDVRAAAWVLHTSWRYFPEGSIFLCVVDPGVGSARLPLALQAGGRTFVGPDNGLFSYVLAESSDACAVSLENPRYIQADRSATFHGRDVFAPAAAWLAAGVAIEDLGPPLATESLARLTLPRPDWREDALIAHVTHIDRFGNILTDLRDPWAQVILAAPALALTIAGHTVTARARTFAEGPEGALFVYKDSSGYLAIAQRNGSAAAALALPVADIFKLTLMVTGIEAPS